MTPLSSAAREQHWNEAQLRHRVLAAAFRLWRYDLPTVVLGRSQQRLLATVDEGMGVDVLQRESGGGAVLTGPWMLGLSAALPPEHPLVSVGLVGSYRWLGELIAQSLQACGVPAIPVSPQMLRACAGTGEITGPPWACFGGLSPWEVVSQGRKIVGLAQVRRSQGVLLVGGVLLDQPPWALLCQALARPAHDAQQLAETTIHCRSASTGAFDAAAFEQHLNLALRQRLLPESCNA